MRVTALMVRESIGEEVKGREGRGGRIGCQLVGGTVVSRGWREVLVMGMDEGCKGRGFPFHVKTWRETGCGQVKSHSGPAFSTHGP